MPRFIDLAGKRFARLFVVGRLTENDKFNHVQWSCRCDCGRTIIAYAQDLRQGKQKSCGCLRAEQSRINGIATATHGHMSRLNYGNGSPEYMSWKNMMQRCTNPDATGHDRYGGAGIKICKRWFRFDNFLADMGPRPKGESLDRINPYGDYKPSNCRWASPLQQRHNRRSL